MHRCNNDPWILAGSVLGGCVLHESLVYTAKAQDRSQGLHAQYASACLVHAGVACGGAVIPLACLLFWRKATSLAACVCKMPSQPRHGIQFGGKACVILGEMEKHQQ